MQKKAILVVSFGTSHAGTREKTITQIEQSIEREFPEYAVRRAFTSRIIIKILKERDQVRVDTEEEALNRLIEEGYEEVIVQPTHIICGFEFDKIACVVEKYRNCFSSLTLGRPLLGGESDFDALAAVLTNITDEYGGRDTGILFMGHGSEHPANASYGVLEEAIRKLNWGFYGIGTVEGEPDILQVIEELEGWHVKKAVLMPLMIVAGDHAVEDMAGENKDSWKSRLSAKGYVVVCVMKGLGEYPAVHKLFIEHIREAMGNIKEL